MENYNRNRLDGPTWGALSRRGLPTQIFLFVNKYMGIYIWLINGGRIGGGEGWGAVNVGFYGIYLH